jgi:two-component system sensor histidine kinase CreC
LRGDMPPAQRERFLNNIDSETARLEALSERLLRLAHVEQRRELEEQVTIPLEPLVAELLEGQAARFAARGIRADNGIPAELAARGERFLIRQALANLIDNAADFTPESGQLSISAEASPTKVRVRVFNEGEPIPDYALPRVTERFYSLPRPATGRKSTGLGLSFVLEVAELHSGTFQIRNVAGGVCAELGLPRG